VKGLETPFSLLGVGHAAGDFDEKGVVLLAPVDEKPVASKVAFAVVFEISSELMITVDG